MAQMKRQPIETAPQSNGWGARIKAYKGFDKNFSCRGYQYEDGKTYIHDGPARCAESRYHSYEMPIDTWSYCGPATSRYAMVVAAGQIDSDGDGDSKIASTELAVNQEIGLSDLIEAAVRWVLDRARSNVVTSSRAHAAATDVRGRAVAVGKYSHVVTTGAYGRAAALGGGGHAVAAGDDGHAVAMGICGHAAATGRRSHAAATGDYAHAVTTGAYGHAATMGAGGHAVTTGAYSHAATMGAGGHAVVKGENSIAAALGFGGTAEAGPDGWIVLARWSDKGDLLEVRAAKVGTEGIEPGKRYRLTAAGFEEVG